VYSQNLPDFFFPVAWVLLLLLLLFHGVVTFASALPLCVVDNEEGGGRSDDFPMVWIWTQTGSSSSSFSLSTSWASLLVTESEGRSLGRRGGRGGGGWGAMAGLNRGGNGGGGPGRSTLPPQELLEDLCRYFIIPFPLSLRPSFPLSLS
jgi:hypothetical protein